jgi:hypothetical protein
VDKQRLHPKTPAQQICQRVAVTDEDRAYSCIDKQLHTGAMRHQSRDDKRSSVCLQTVFTSTCNTPMLQSYMQGSLGLSLQAAHVGALPT